MQNPVLIGAFATTMDADLARLRLHSEGIHARVVEHLSFNPALSDALGGVRLQVDEKDRERAEEILAEPFVERPEERLATYREQAVVPDEEAKPAVLCPRCDLEYCFFEKPRLLGAQFNVFTLVGTVVMYAFSKKRWRCHKCGHAWDDLEDCPEHKTIVEAGDPRPVFRLRRTSAGMGLFIGIIAGFVTMLATSGASLWLGLLFIAAGWLIGSSMRTDVCSEPNCRAPLAREATRCERCKGHVAGEIKHAGDHYAETATFRRELAASRSSEDES